MTDSRMHRRDFLGGLAASSLLLSLPGRALARDMLATSPLGLRLTKEGLNLSIDAPSLDAAVALEDRGQILCASAGFFTEGIDAFLHKRAADYGDG